MIARRAFRAVRPEVSKGERHRLAVHGSIPHHERPLGIGCRPCVFLCKHRLSATFHAYHERMTAKYNAADIEVLSGLEPVKRRPGMYTDTTRPNHLVQEVVDNSVDEALAGHAKTVEVILHTDGSVEVSDDGRGMP